MKNPDHFYLIKAPRDLCAGQWRNGKRFAKVISLKSPMLIFAWAYYSTKIL